MPMVVMNDQDTNTRTYTATHWSGRNTRTSTSVVHFIFVSGNRFWLEKVSGKIFHTQNWHKNARK